MRLRNCCSVAALIGQFDQASTSNDPYRRCQSGGDNDGEHAINKGHMLAPYRIVCLKSPLRFGEAGDE